MKKALFIIAAIATCMTANAKYWFGGSLGFESTSLYDTDPKEHVMTFSPSFGMAIEDNLELGVDLTIADEKWIKAGGTEQKAFSFGFAPFLRYTFLTEGNFNMFVQGGFEYGIYSPSGYNYWSLTFQVQPGIRYMMSDHFSLVAKFDGLYFTHESRPDELPPFGTFKNNVGAGFDFSDLKFGLIYEF